jgi:hypothetical protein
MKYTIKMFVPPTSKSVPSFIILSCTEYRLLGRDTVFFGKYVSTLRRSMLRNYEDTLIVETLIRRLIPGESF